MKNCRYCKEEVGDKEQICPYCGYDFKTDTLTPGCVKNEKVDTDKKKKLVGSGIRTFMFWAILIIIFSLIFKYRGNVSGLIDQAKNFVGIKGNKAAQAFNKANANKSLGLVDVRSVKIPAEKSERKEKKVEGIFYDANNKSYVIINGQLVSEGESFEGMLIKKVNKDSVEIVKDGNIQTLKVYTNLK